MTITIEQIKMALIRFIDTNLAPKMSGIGKFALYFVTPSIYNNLPLMFEELKKFGTINDLLDEAGNIKLEETYNRAKEAMKKSGKVLIPKLNYFADESDLDILYNYIKNT